jgi:MoaA/NifB/PqqE/SkfB family radical SAM enzyme
VEAVIRTDRLYDDGIKDPAAASYDTSKNDASLSIRSGEVVDADGFARYVDDRLDFSRLTLSLEVAGACNLRCPGCWVSMARPGMWTASPSDLMSPALFDAALGFGRELGASKLTLLGGEPTLHPNLPNLIQSGTEAGYQVSITTNGVCSSGRLAAILRGGIHGISFSLDGSTAQIHDALRPSPNGRSTFHLTLASLREAVRLRSNYGYKVSVNHTIYPRNLHDAEAMIRLSARLAVDQARLHFTLPGDDGLGTFIDPESWLALWSRIPDLTRELGVAISAPQGYGSAAVAAAAKRKSPYLNVQPDGTLVLCAAYARLPGRTDQSLGRLLPNGTVQLNRVSSRVTEGNHCCGALPRLIERLPVSLQERIKSVGGLGCIILSGPLIDPAEAAPA